MRELIDDLVSAGAAFAPSRFPYGRFALTLILGLVAALAFVWVKMPLPWLLGPMAICTIAAVGGAPVAAPHAVRSPMTVILGVLIGGTFSPEIVQSMVDWLPTIAGLVACLIVSGIVSMAYLRLVGGFDFATAYFAGMPGGLIEMVILGEHRGADVGMIALSHSARILMIVFAVPIIVGLIAGTTVSSSSVPRPSMIDLTALDYGWFVLTALVGVVVGYVLRFPARLLLGPMLISSLVHVTGASAFAPPIEIVNAAQLVIGAALGCRFVGGSMKTILRIFALSIGSTVILLGVTAIFALIMSRLSSTGFIPLFLGYAPGGVAEMCLIALALHIEVAFVAAHHIVRLVLVFSGAGLVFTLFKRF